MHIIYMCVYVSVYECSELYTDVFCHTPEIHCTIGKN